MGRRRTGAEGFQKGGNIAPAAGVGKGQGGMALGIGQIDLGTQGDQALDQKDLAAGHRLMQESPSGCIRGVDVGPLGNDEGQDIAI